MGFQNLRLAGLVAATALTALQAVCALAQSPMLQRQKAVQGNEATPSNESGTLTGKERLGRKWSDEQRLDNCNVPIEKRGSQPRPSECTHAPTI